MSAIAIFSFENSQVRTTGTAEKPLFVAVDIATVLGYSNARKAIYAHVDEEDRLKATVETEGGKQEVVCVNESGLYAIIFGSKLESAKRFKRWVTSEVLPAIRRTGRYECPANPQYLTDKQCWAIQSAVGKRARGQGAHFQTIYHALKARFQVPTYTRILSKDFDAALAFIQTCELKVPVTEAQAPQIEAAPQLPEGSVVLTPKEAELLLTLIYYVRFLFSDTFEAVYKMMRIAQSPIAGRMYDAFHEVPWGRMLDILARHGHDISDMPCYKHWLAGRRAA